MARNFAKFFVEQNMITVHGVTVADDKQSYEAEIEYSGYVILYTYHLDGDVTDVGIAAPGEKQYKTINYSDLPSQLATAIDDHINQNAGKLLSPDPTPEEEFPPKKPVPGMYNKTDQLASTIQ